MCIFLCKSFKEITDTIKKTFDYIFFRSIMFSYLFNVSYLMFYLISKIHPRRIPLVKFSWDYHEYRYNAVGLRQRDALKESKNES